MEERDVRGNIVLEQFVNDALVVVEAFRVRLAGSVGKNARPRDGETVAGDTQVLKQLHIFFIEMVRVIGDIASFALKCFTWRVGERIPDGRLPSVFVHCTLNLIGSGRAAPDEVGRKSQQTRRSQLGQCDPRQRGAGISSRGGAGKSLTESATREIFHRLKKIITSADSERNDFFLLLARNSRAQGVIFLGGDRNACGNPHYQYCQYQ